MTRSREGRESRPGVVSVPHSSSRWLRLDALSTTPYPRTAVPGSMPSTLTGVASGFCLRQLCRVNIEVGEDLGDIIQLFQHIHQTHNALGIGTLNPHSITRNHGQLG